MNGCLTDVRIGRVRRARRLVVLASLALWSSVAVAGDDLQEFRALVHKLIALQEVRYQALAEWADVRPVVAGRVRVLRQQRQQAREQLDAAREQEKRLRTEKAEAESARGQAQSRYLELAAPLREAEQRLRELTIRLPRPLLDRLAEDLQALPDPALPVDPDTLPERLRFVFGVLTEVQQFAGNVHLVKQRLRGPDGEVREMDVLYLGLGAAFAVSAADRLAAWGSPGESDWTWHWDPDIAGDVRAAVEVFQKLRPAQFVRLPLRLASSVKGAE